jgi:aldose 1-epimerase
MHDYRVNLTQKGFPSCKLSPYACRIKDGRYTFENKEYQIGKFGYDRHSIHGLLYDVPFEVLHVEELEQSTSILLGMSYRGSDVGFPFKYSINIEYKISDEGEVRYKTKVQNIGSLPMPLMDGWHPYFSLPSKLDDCVLAIEAKECLEFNQDLIPTGRLKQYSYFMGGNKVEKVTLDHCFPLQGISGLVCSFDQMWLQLYVLKSKLLPIIHTLQLFIPPDRKSIAIELLSGAPDAFNNKMGLIVLQPSEIIEFECVYSISKL